MPEVTTVATRPQVTEVGQKDASPRITVTNGTYTSPFEEIVRWLSPHRLRAPRIGRWPSMGNPGGEANQV